MIGANADSSSHTVGDNTYFSNGILASNQNYLVSADSAVANNLTGEIEAEGDVVIVDHGLLWRGTNAVYHFRRFHDRQCHKRRLCDLPFHCHH